MRDGRAVMSIFYHHRSWLLGFLTVLIVTTFLPLSDAKSAQYAAVIMDARSGKVLHSSNANTKLHPASLTKMMTLYVAFEAVENGEISLDKKITISKKASQEVPSKMYYKAGTKVSFRYLIRAAALRSANDAATAIAEAVAGSERAFANRMNLVARMMGMKNTHFVNAHGLTENGHYSTAMDMSKLGRHVIYDYPEYFHLFSKIDMYASGTQIYNSNRRFLKAYSGADGIKTGYTSKAGFNLVATAKRGNKRIITTVFGGRSVVTRNNEVARLMDIGFNKAASNVRLVKPQTPPYSRFSINGIALAELDAPLLRPNNNFKTIEEVVVVESTTEIDKLFSDPNITEIYAGDTFDPPTPDEKEKSLFKNIPQRPIELTALKGLDDLTRNAGVSLGLFYSKQQADKKSIEVFLAVPRELRTPAKEHIVEVNNNYQLQFIWLTEAQAVRVCETLSHRGQECEVLYLG